MYILCIFNILFAENLKYFITQFYSMRFKNNFVFSYQVFSIIKVINSTLF